MLVFVVMPTLDGNMTEPTRALFELVGDGKKLGPYTFISRKVTSYDTATARNIGTSLALESAAGKMLMLDADMNAGAAQVLRILAHAEPFVGAPYPKKVLSFEQEWVYNLHAGKSLEPRADGLAPALHVGGGFFALDLNALELVAARHPELRFLSEYGYDRGREMFALWDPLVVTDNWGLTGTWPRRLTDDFAMCHRIQAAGFPLYLDTICQVGHIGPVDFLAVMAMIAELTGGRDQTPPQALSSRSAMEPERG